MPNEQMEQLVNNLIQIEHVSSTLYLAMSNYMNKLNFKGMGTWLRLQSEEERLHMLKLMDYLVNRGGTVELKAVPAQPTEYGTPLETFQKVLEHEQFVTNSYRQAYDYVNKMNNDQQTLIILQEFLKEQVDEEAQSQTIVDRLKLAQNNPAALLLLDQELGKRQPAPAPAGG
ncbi:ferritin [Ectobacillus antri]|jgi:ferritin|uniref:Ferritin n=1 Tax=Ectobacillus antri TaxID=2486280 RepID=A0ABT6H803_9BACI|nr:ferritin [Ectobacillus antri]MDG4658459.1 ferritin [Ectobacillus antri]MDG5755462.1 ferritin [Ectobacillus antri]